MGNPRNERIAEAEEGLANLEAMFERADAIDLREGANAYFNYNKLMRQIADRYDFSLERTIAAFAALSPNNDYFGNLRSLVSVMDGYRKGVPTDQIIISTYGHCRNRAIQYLSGQVDYLQSVKGPKIRAFYFNILDPNNKDHVTIDGHMIAAWNGTAATMKDSIVGRRQYEEVAEGCMMLASKRCMLPHQYQATIWFTRKRVLNIRYDSQLDVLAGPTDQWRIMRDLQDLKPYPIKGATNENPSDKRPAMGRPAEEQLQARFCFPVEGAGEEV